VCLGVNLAYMELRILLAKMVWWFDWEIVQGAGGKDVDWERDTRLYTLWKKPSLMVRFKTVAGKMD
jgi:cytochrome P450